MSTPWMLSGTATSASDRASSMRSPSRRRTPSSSSDFVTSSTKSGLPSALAVISADSSSGNADACRMAVAIAAMSWGLSAPSVMRRW